MAQVAVVCTQRDYFVGVDGERPRLLPLESGHLARPVTAAETVLASDAFYHLPVGAAISIGGNPDTVELVRIVAHVENSPMIYVTRGCEGTIARAWALGTYWQRVVWQP